MINYCECCDKEVKTRIITENVSIKVLGEEVLISAQLMVCAICGAPIFNEDLDSKMLLSAYNEYRIRHKLLLPDEIKHIREQYGLSQRSFSKLLNWGDKTICRYENGSIQDKAHNSLLVLLRNPVNMKTYLTENEVTIDEKKKKKLFDVIENMIENGERNPEKEIIDLYFSNTPCEDNGFKGFDYDKLCSMVLYFSNKSTKLLKTKLIKLLNYSDMYYYKKYGVSISGLKYIHLKYGPVPDNFDMILGLMSADHIAHIDVSYDHGYECHRVVPECGIPDDGLSELETEVLEIILRKFRNYGSSEISEYAHKEKGYRITKLGEIISYSYAKDLSVQ